MKKLFIVRHGHRLDQYCRDSWLAHPRRSENAWDMPLSPIGEINSYAAGEELVKHLPTVKKIYTSPMSRCVKTAEIISKHYPGAVIHKHYGLKEGNNIIDSIIKNNKEYEETYIDIKDVESIAEEVVRVVSTICHILNESDDDVLIVGHSGTLMYFYYVFNYCSCPSDTNGPRNSYLEKLNEIKFHRDIDTSKIVGFSVQENNKTVIYPPNNDFCSFEKL